MLLYAIHRMKIFFILFIFFTLNKSYANNVGGETGLELPRYVSLKSNESNLRVGPSKNYPIKIKYIINNLPLKIIEEYDDWRQIVDLDDNTGWIHKSLLKGERYAIIISSEYKNIAIFNTANGKRIGEVGVGTIVYLSKCMTNWCLMIKDNHKGWLKKKYLWGVKNNEIFNIGIFQTLIDYYYKSINLLDKYIS